MTTKKAWQPLPKSIPIGGWKWTIKQTPNLKDDEGSRCHGLTSVDRRIVQIDQELSLEEKWHTLLHEAIHGAWFLGGQSEELSDEKEEALIRCADGQLWPWLRQYIGRE